MIKTHWQGGAYPGAPYFTPRIDEPPQKKEYGSTVQKACEWLMKHPRSHATKVADAIGITQQHASSLLQKQVKRNVVKVAARKIYRGKPVSLYSIAGVQ